MPGRWTLLLDGLHFCFDLMNELREIKKQVQPDLSLYVLDSMVGQSALETAKQFEEEVKSLQKYKTPGTPGQGLVLA